MSQENVEIVRRIWEHVKQTDEPDWSLVDPDIEIHDTDLPDGGIFRGHAGWREWIDYFSDAWEYIEVEPEECIDVGDARVVLVLRLVAQGRDGIAVKRHDGVVHTVRRGKLARIDYYGNRAEALEAVGLSG